MQKHVGKLRVQLQWRLALHEGAWYMHKYVALYMYTMSLLLNCTFHGELVNLRGHKLAEVAGYLTYLTHISHNFGFFLWQLDSSKLKSSNYAEYRHELDTQVMLIGCLLYSGKNGASEAGWGFLWVIFFGLVAAGIAGYAVYKYRIRVRNRKLVSADTSMFITFW